MLRLRTSVIGRIAGGAALAIVAAASAQTPAAGQGWRAGWLAEAGWGVFMHYLADGPEMPVAEWNRRIDHFDVEGLARQLESVKARYFFITLGQNSGHYLAPNRTYDRLTGIRPSKCSTRDLVGDLYPALARRGIRLLVYLPSGAPDQDQVAVERLEWKRGPNRNLHFQRNWEKVIQDWSVRFGKKVSGWWFDGCYWPNAMYRSAKPPNFASFAAAVRKGNPDAIVAFNRGVVYPIHSETDQEDYTAGETDDPTRVRVSEFWQDGARFQMLSYLGTRWSGGPPRFSDEQVAAITRRIRQKDGAATWDVPHQPDGLIPEPFLRQLRAIAQD